MLTKKEPETFTYEEAAAYIEEIPKFTKKHTLEHTKMFLKRLGNPAADRKIPMKELHGITKSIWSGIRAHRPSRTTRWQR